MKRFFNLIEIVLAMAVLAVGMTGVMALFPVGFKANSESVETNNAVLVANKLYSIIKASKSKYSGTPWVDQSWFLNTNIPAPPSHRPGTFKDDPTITELYCGTPFICDSNAENRQPISVSSGYDPFGLYAVGDSDKGRGSTIYPGLIYAETGVEDPNTPYKIPLPSFTAHIRLWWYPVFKAKSDDLTSYKPSERWKIGWNGSRTNGTNYEMFSKDDIVGVYMEVSWPATIPWSNRTYRYFYFELYRKN